MGSVGDCFDNAMCESFFATLECELLAKHQFHSQAQAIPIVFEYIRRLVQHAASSLVARSDLADHVRKEAHGRPRKQPSGKRLPRMPAEVRSCSGMSPRSGASEAKQRPARSPINRSPHPSTESGQLQKRAHAPCGSLRPNPSLQPTCYGWLRQPPRVAELKRSADKDPTR